MILKKTSTITFRIDLENDIRLRQIAEHKKISLNTLANQILGNYIQLERYMEKFGVVLMSQNAFKAMLSALNEKDLLQLASDIGSKEPKEFILFKWKELNYDVVIEFIKIYFEHCGYGACDIDRTESKTSISIHHNFGEKGSLYLKTFLESILQSTLEKSCETIITQESITLSFSE